MAPDLDRTAVLPAREVTAWDDEADVVVVGLGVAGACTALGAIEADAAADVLVLEAAGGGGGLSAQSGGILYLGGGTPVQEACGFTDTPDDMYDFLVAATGPGPDEAKLRVFCDESVAFYHWLVDHGVPFKAGFFPEPGIEPPTEDGLVFSGGEDAWPFDRIVRPAPRGHKPRHRHAAGGFLMQCLLAAVEATSTRITTDTHARRLVVDDDGRVIGVLVRRHGHAVAVRARRGVVLCAGGFVRSDEMVAEHVPLVARCNLRLGTDFDDGRGIRMAQAAGARAVHLDAAECAVPITPPRKLVGGILVNGRGQRFINEDTYYGRVGQEALFHQGGEMYLIVDEELYEVNRAGFQAAWVCESADELEAEMGLPEGSLVATLELYNRHAEHGEDPVFHKAAAFVRPLTGALGAYDLRTQSAFYATFTLGGLHTTVDGEVLDLDGSPIAGLYAAGRTTSGLAAHGYASGLSLADGAFFGRRAGIAAATSATAASPAASPS
ncbi:MAG: FAD-dependent oxidoreductase [Acidimicrobiales bacterium]